MGWDYCQAWTTLGEAIAGYVSDIEHSGTYKVVDRELAHEKDENVLWAVVTGGKLNRAVIVCVLFNKTGGCWGYKEMDEGMHPYYYSCPERFLAQVPVLSEEWRSGVATFQKARVWNG